MIAVDIETTIEARPKLAVVAVGTPDGQLHVEHTRGQRPSERMKALLESDDWITHNGTNFDIKVLRDHGIQPPAAHYDTLVGEGVLLTTGRTNIRKNLAATQKRRLGRTTKGSVDHGLWMRDSLTATQMDYIREDVLPLFEIQSSQQAEADKRGLRLALDNEQRLTPIMAKMCYHGMPIRLDYLEAALAEMYENYKEAEWRLQKKYGGSFNARSHVQVKAALRRFDLPNTGADTLALYAWDQDVADILLVRKNKKNVTMYDADWVHQFVYDNAVRSSYWQTGTDTIRFSSSQPNVQQIPKIMRKVFAGPDGTYFIKADYSQLELRTLAAITQDPQLIQDLLEDADVPSWISEQVFDLSWRDPRIDEGTEPIFEEHPIYSYLHSSGVPRLLRDRSKGWMYGWGYGGGARAEESVFMQINADGYRYPRRQSAYAALRQRYPKVQTYRQVCTEKLKSRQSFELPWGHRRRLPGGASPAAAIATEPQGSAAVGMKESLFEIDAAGLSDDLCAIVHDEMVLGPFEYEQAQELAPVVVGCMERGMQKIVGDAIKILVVAEVEHRWSH